MAAFASDGTFVVLFDGKLELGVTDGNAENGSLLRDAAGLCELAESPDEFDGKAGNVGAELPPAIGCV